ncbi:MAG: M15 family metallopeptidase [Ornithinimicrobium sp.]
MAAASAMLLPTQSRGFASTLRGREFQFTDLERNDREHLLAVVTKEEALRPLDYAPPDLVPWRDSAYEMRAEVVEQLESLFAGADRDEVYLRVISGFRSYATQGETYRSWVRTLGRSAAQVSSARPGHSEHQTGLAVDLDGADGDCYLDPCFGKSVPGRWVATNAFRFGFVVSYPKGYQDRTGYVYEPWHIRYVGPSTAQAMHQSGVTFLQDYLSPQYAFARIGWHLGHQLGTVTRSR